MKARFFFFGYTGTSKLCCYGLLPISKALTGGPVLARYISQLQSEQVTFTPLHSDFKFLVLVQSHFWLIPSWFTIRTGLHDLMAHEQRVKPTQTWETETKQLTKYPQSDCMLEYRFWVTFAGPKSEWRRRVETVTLKIQELRVFHLLFVFPTLVLSPTLYMHMSNYVSKVTTSLISSDFRK